MSDPELKVTDKRMFTPEGELREEYRERVEGGERTSEEAGGQPEAGPPPEERRGEPLPPPTFLDLVGLLAQTAGACLGDEQPSPQLARFHIDLLDLLSRKTRGNLDASEQAALKDVLYRLRMLYVEKTSD